MDCRLVFCDLVMVALCLYLFDLRCLALVFWLDSCCRFVSLLCLSLLLSLELVWLCISVCYCCVFVIMTCWAWYYDSPVGALYALTCELLY